MEYAELLYPYHSEEEGVYEWEDDSEDDEEQIGMGYIQPVNRKFLPFF